LIIGIGTDIIEIERIKQAILAGEGKFTTRVYTPAEIAYCQSKRNCYSAYAARFAAKEAVLKALGCGFIGVSWQDIEVVKPEGAPVIVLWGKALEIAQSQGVSRVHISLSHSNSQAVAYAVAEG
jgi:holo-[acyl-carrier protein] synthase